MKYKLLLLFLVIFYKITFAQWTVSSYPNDFTYFELVSFLDEKKIVGVDYNGFVYSDDGGITFVRKSTNNFPTKSRLQFYSDSLIFINQLKLKKSTDLGQNWQTYHILNANKDTFITGNVNCFNFFYNGRGFLLSNLNNRYKLYKTINLGLTWEEKDSSKIDLPPFRFGGDILKNQCFVFDSVVYTNNNNMTELWKIVNYGDSVFGFKFDSVFKEEIRTYAFKSEMEGLFIGASNNIYKTIDGCSTFSIIGQTPQVANIMDYAKRIGSKVPFYFISNASPGNSYYSKDDGKSWQSVGDLFSFSSIDFFNANVGISSDARIGERIRYFGGLTGVNENLIGDDVCNIFPNPISNNEFHISLSKFAGSSFSIFNLQGQLVKSGILIEKDNIISTHELGYGTFLINIFNDNTIFRKKILIL